MTGRNGEQDVLLEKDIYFQPRVGQGQDDDTESHAAG